MPHHSSRKTASSLRKHTLMSARHTRSKSADRQPAASSPVKEVRSIPPLVRLLLFVRAGGRCEFDGCNKYLLEHHVTLTEGNFAQIAHIVAFRPEGPRGHAGAARPQNINDVENLMLLCPGCHKLIDDQPERYTRKTLAEYKKRHEEHVRHMTGLSPEHKTSLLIFTANIGEQASFIPYDHLLEAVSPYYPASRPGKVIDLTAIRIEDASSLATAQDTIKRRMAELYDSGSEVHAVKHLSVFALGPIPLLVYLGSRLSNKIPTALFQRHRDRENWTWKPDGKPAQYQFKRIRPGNDSSRVALLLSLSGTIPVKRLPEDIDARYSVYELTLKNQTPAPTFLNTRQDLEGFRIAYQQALGHIMGANEGLKSLHLFPAVPTPIAILCGRELLPKVHPELLVYDFDKQKVGFTFQVKVNANEH